MVRERYASVPEVAIDAFARFFPDLEDLDIRVKMVPERPFCSLHMVNPRLSFKACSKH